MAYLRHSARHVQQSILDRVEAGLLADGWLGPEVPFGADAVVWMPRRMSESELVSVTGNLVAVSFGGEDDDIPQELGGGVTLIQHVILVDVIGSDDSISLAIASDVKDRLAGLAGTSRFEPVYNYTVTPRTPVLGWLIEFENVQRVRPQSEDYRRLWNVVTADANVYLTGNE